jgi:hypothetical protein
VALLGGFQRQPQHGPHIVRFGFRFSGIGSQPAPVSFAVFARCWARNACQPSCAVQGLLFQRAAGGRKRFVSLLSRQYCAIAGLTHKVGCVANLAPAAVAVNEIDRGAGRHGEFDPRLGPGGRRLWKAALPSIRFLSLTSNPFMLCSGNTEGHRSRHSGQSAQQPCCRHQ